MLDMSSIFLCVHRLLSIALKSNRCYLRVSNEKSSRCAGIQWLGAAGWASPAVAVLIGAGRSQAGTPGRLALQNGWHGPCNRIFPLGFRPATPGAVMGKPTTRRVRREKTKKKRKQPDIDPVTFLAAQRRLWLLMTLNNLGWDGRIKTEKRMDEVSVLLS